MRTDEREGLISLVRLIGQPAPERWVDQWISVPNRRLDGRRPLDMCSDRSSRLRIYAVAAIDADLQSLDP